MSSFCDQFVELMAKKENYKDITNPDAFLMSLFDLSQYFRRPELKNLIAFESYLKKTSSDTFAKISTKKKNRESLV